MHIPISSSLFSVPNVLWYISWIFSWTILTLATFSRAGRRVKLRCYAAWCRVYVPLVVATEMSPLGRSGRGRHVVMTVWLLACLTWPVETSLVCLALLGFAALVDSVDWFLEACLTARPDVRNITLLLNSTHQFLDNDGLRAVLRRRWAAGEVAYNHMGQVSGALAQRVTGLGGCLEPLTLEPEAVQAVYDDTYILTCGRFAGGAPVVARCGSSVLVGSLASTASLPPGYELTAPLLVTRPPSSFFRTLRVSFSGRGTPPAPGQIALLGTATTASMATAVSGVLYATFHATGGRPMAGPSGSRNPFWCSSSQDVACYPLSAPMSSLEPCSCGGSSCWVVTVHGHLLHGVLQPDQRVGLDCPVSIQSLKGSSGSPILCDAGHAVGMMVGATVRDGIASRVRYVVPWKIKPGDTSASGVPDFPTVPRTGYKEVGYIAPTGSGKSTKFPAALTKEGHKVLVLNPSVVTTQAMQKYMKSCLGRSPNIFAGHGKHSRELKTGSPLTYATYGRFLVNPEDFLKDVTVVICDECHSTDPTTVLGCGMVRVLAEKAGVKLVVFATATPPGTTMTKHPNITEHTLDGEGSIPYYGLTLHPDNYKTGRHVIFCHSKAECTRVAGELAQAGCTTVTYWRGKDPKVITEDPNLVVVATDALSTGYTGNFSSSTDCCSAVTETVEVDLDPTFSITLRVGPADAALRMQRRGRTGRGSPGTYYAVHEGAPPAGMCSSGTLWGAVETGHLWYGFDSARMTTLLQAYQDCCYTSRLPGDLDEPVKAFAALKHLWHCPEATAMALKEVSWPMLTGIQRRLCAEVGSCAPSDDMRWAGLRGDAAVPLLYRLGSVDAPATVRHALTTEIGKALGDTSYHDTGVGPLLLAGAAIAAAVAFAGATGTLAITSVWEVHTGGSPRYVDAIDAETNHDTQKGGPIPQAAVEELATSLDWPGLTLVWGALNDGVMRATSTGKWVADSLCHWWSTGAPFTVASVPAAEAALPVVDIIRANITAFMTGGCAVVGAKAAPAFAALSALVCGTQVACPSHVRWLLTVLGGMCATCVGGTGPGLAVGGAFFVGSHLAGLSVVDAVVGCAAGYEAAVCCAAMVLDLLDGKAKVADLMGCLPAILAPGAAAAGIALAVVARGFVGGDYSSWVNRLLTLLPRGNAMPDGFFVEARNFFTGDRVRRLSIVSIVRRLLAEPDEPGYVQTGTWVNNLYQLAENLARYLLSCLQSLGSRCARALVPAVPIVACQRPWRGGWRGTGSVRARCACGAAVTATIQGGDPIFNAPRACRSYWQHGVPINTDTVYSGDVMPDVSRGEVFTFPVGVTGLLTCDDHNGRVRVLKTTEARLKTRDVMAACLRGPVVVDGASVSACYVLTSPTTFGPGQAIEFDGQMTTLPITMTRAFAWSEKPYTVSWTLEDDPHTAEEVIGPCEKAVEAMQTLADEAVDVAEATVRAANTMFSAAFEARRRAEMDAWRLREAGYGRDLFDDAIAMGDDCEDLGLLNRHAAAMEEDPSLFASDEEGDPQPTKTTQETGAEPDGEGTGASVPQDPQPPAPLNKEPLLQGVQAPSDGALHDAVRGVRDTYGAAKNLAVVVGGGAVALARRAAVAVTAVAAGVAEVSAAPVAYLAERITLPPLLGMQTVKFSWSCGGGGVGSGTLAYGSKLRAFADAAGVPSDHDHEFWRGGVSFPGDLDASLLSDETITVACKCKKPPGPKSSVTVIKTLRHTCCGEDRSLTKHVGARAPAVLLNALFGDAGGGTWYDGDRAVGDEEELGDLGPVLDLVHDESCGRSYIWSGIPVSLRTARAAPITRPLTAQLRADASKIYSTDPAMMAQRIDKVTIDQTVATEDAYLRDARNLALAKASKILSPGFSYDEAVAKTKPRTARGHVAKITRADLFSERGRRAVMDCLDGIRTGTYQGPFMLTPKVEVFPKTKDTWKPPRLIVYPSLEMRVAEKMILGDPARVVKAVMGPAYGFQYTPAERPKVLMEMWNSKRLPIAYTLDGVCFDSTVTPEDIKFEGEVFARASGDPAAVRALHEYYASGPMMDCTRRTIGIRRCRASGTLTTSAGNSLTCFLKVSAACRKAGIKNPSFLIHGDDTVVIAEKTEEDLTQALGDALRSYGYECVPTAHADLSSAESCSATLDTVKTVRGGKHVLRPDGRRMLARVMGEYGDPVGAAWGYTLAYPAHPLVMYVLLPLLLNTAVNSGGADQLITIDYRGNQLTLPLTCLGAAIRRLHGPDALAIIGHSASVLADTFQTLAFYKMRGLGHWRRQRKLTCVRLLRHGRAWANLARELLWTPGGTVGPVMTESNLLVPEEFWEAPWEGLAVTVSHSVGRPRWPLWVAALLGFLLLI